MAPNAVTCDASDGTVEVHPPAQNPDGSYVGVASYDGNGRDYVPMIKEDVSFAPDPEVGRASGQADGSNVLIPANITQSGNYYTVVYYGNDHCQSQPVPLP